MFKVIAAMSENRVIGCGSKIPWHVPEDFKWFKTMTTGNIVVMGRKTFESIGRPLPNRETVIVSRRGFSHPGVRTISSLHELDPLTGFRDIFICGGAEIYALALPVCSELYVTLIKRTVEGDVFFPPFEDHFEPAEVIRDNSQFRITRYCRRTSAVT